MINKFDDVLDVGKIDISTVEQKRKKEYLALKSEIRKLLAVVALACALVIFATYYYDDRHILVGLIFILWGFSSWKNKKKRKIMIPLKNKVINQLISLIDESLTYEAESFVPKEIFTESQIIKKNATYKGEDLFSGVVNNVSFQFSEVTYDYRSGKRTVTVFEGPFFVVKSPIRFRSRTSVLHDKLENVMGDVGRFFQSMNVSRINEKLIKIDNHEFEKHFAVYTKNEDEAKSILTKNMCDYLVSIKKQFGDLNKVYFSFSENYFYLGIDNRKDIFEVDVSKEITNENIKSFYDEFVNYVNIVLKIHSLLPVNSQN